MIASNAIPAQIAKLIPILSSDKDGEVIAAARAICRTLRRDGLDIHDLTKALVPKDVPTGPSRKAPNWLSLPFWERSRWLAAVRANLPLTAWEDNFLDTVRRANSLPPRPLSPKQIHTIQMLLARAAATGVRP